MKKTWGYLLAGLLLILALTGCGIDRSKLKGTITFSSKVSLNDGRKDGITLYTPSTNEWKTILEGAYGEVLSYNSKLTKE